MLSSGFKIAYLAFCFTAFFVNVALAEGNEKVILKSADTVVEIVKRKIITENYYGIKEAKKDVGPTTEKVGYQTARNSYYEKFLPFQFDVKRTESVKYPFRLIIRFGYCYELSKEVSKNNEIAWANRENANYTYINGTKTAHGTTYGIQEWFRVNMVYEFNATKEFWELAYMYESPGDRKKAVDNYFLYNLIESPNKSESNRFFEGIMEIKPTINK